MFNFPRLCSASGLRLVASARPGSGQVARLALRERRVYQVVEVVIRAPLPIARVVMGFELDAREGRLLYVPEGCAHGYLTLTDDAELMYFTSAPYAPDAARGVRHDDPAFAIAWPAPVTTISPQDAAWPDFRMTHP